MLDTAGVACQDAGMHTTTVQSAPGRQVCEGDALPVVILRCSENFVIRGELVAADLDNNGVTIIRTRDGECHSIRHAAILDCIVVSTGLAA